MKLWGAFWSKLTIVAKDTKLFLNILQILKLSLIRIPLLVLVGSILPSAAAADQGRQIQIWIGELVPDFPIIGGVYLPPEFAIIGRGKRQIFFELFLTPLKPVFWTFHEGYPEIF